MLVPWWCDRLQLPSKTRSGTRYLIRLGHGIISARLASNSDSTDNVMKTPRQQPSGSLCRPFHIEPSIITLHWRFLARLDGIKANHSWNIMHIRSI